MSEDTDVVKKPPKGELSCKVVRAIEHNIRVMDVAMPNCIHHVAEPKSIHSDNHVEEEGSTGTWDAEGTTRGSGDVQEGT